MPLQELNSSEAPSVKLLLHALGWVLLIVTIGLASCQTLLKAAPNASDAVASTALVPGMGP